MLLEPRKAEFRTRWYTKSRRRERETKEREREIEKTERLQMLKTEAAVYPRHQKAREN